MTRYITGILGTAVMLFVLAQPARAQGSITLSPNNNTPQMQDYSIGDAQFRGVLAQAMRERDLAAAELAAMQAGNKTSMTLDQEADKEKSSKTYRYEGKKSLFHGAGLPKRTFNNIEYPY
ncbi:MAG: hypothetical protein CO093_04640 [Alphaproteobacteria bacterium CG_4_9_14_3_um_filter_47_13]|nr:MAG: hypothetical protein CO093_04640 [Alphaproteobacteria bacterium CG_4_9_14_3_um_filter_47_13]